MYTIPTSGACAASSIAGTSSEKSGRRLTVLTAAPPTTASGAAIEYPGEIGSTVFPPANVSTSARIASLDPLVTATSSGATPCDRASAPRSASASTGGDRVHRRPPPPPPTPFFPPPGPPPPPPLFFCFSGGGTPTPPPPRRCGFARGSPADLAWQSAGAPARSG